MISTIVVCYILLSVAHLLNVHQFENDCTHFHIHSSIIYFVVYLREVPYGESIFSGLDWTGLDWTGGAGSCSRFLVTRDICILWRGLKSLGEETQVRRSP